VLEQLDEIEGLWEERMLEEQRLGQKRQEIVQGVKDLIVQLIALNRDDADEQAVSQEIE
jgi:hypothetical protein